MSTIASLFDAALIAIPSFAVGWMAKAAILEEKERRKEDE